MPNLSSAIVRSLADRQAVLWACQRYDLREGQDVHQYDIPASTASLRYRKELTTTDREIAKLYWEAAWFEGAQSPLLNALRAAGIQKPESRAIIVLAAPSDVDARVPVEEFLPIYILPGVIDASSPLDAQYGTVKPRVRERTAWAFASKLTEFPSRVLVVLGAKQRSDLDYLFDVLEDLPSVDLTVLVSWPIPHTPEPPHLPKVKFEWWQGSDNELASALCAAGAPLATQLPDWSVRVGARAVSFGAKDVRHVLAKFALLTERDILPPREFDMDDLHAFLRGDLNNWKAYGAGLPVSRSYRTDQDRAFDIEIQELLERLSRGEDESFSLTVQLPAEGGAGVSTLLRNAAYRAASAGFPTLVLRPDQVDIELDHILAFSDSIADKLASVGAEQQPPLLIVSDVEHGAISALKQIPQLLASRNRKVMLLQAISLEDTNSVAKRTRRFIRLNPLEIKSSEIEAAACQGIFSSLASRWNLPLQPRTTDDWQSYERATRWRSTGTEDHIESLFWVALRFFLVEGLTDDQRESLESAIGAWIDKRTDAVVDVSMKRVLDFTAVLSSFRIAAPIWTVLRPITGGTFSSSVVEALRSTQDVVIWGAQVDELQDQTLRFAHPALAEHYLNRRGIRDSVAKLATIKPVITSLSAGHPADVWLAESIVTDVLMPDYLGRRQFDWEWRLDAFKGIPPLVRDQSKAILHHWARSLYQSADAPGLDGIDKRTRIELAIDKLRAAIKLPRRSTRDEHPSHLYNTLGTAYARYARLLEQSEDLANASSAWKDARHAFQEAINLGGGVNVEALLAFSLRLIDHADQSMARDRVEATSEVAYALDLLDEAESALSEVASPDPELDEQLVQYRARALAGC